MSRAEEIVMQIITSFFTIIAVDIRVIALIFDILRGTLY